MDSSNVPEKTYENETTLSQIVIESERLGDPGAMLCLRVDSHLIARNLTTAQIKFLICEILDRIEGKNEPKGVEHQLH